MKHKTEDKKCLNCAHLKKKKIYEVSIIAIVIVLLAIVFLIPANDLTNITGRWLERERHIFVVSAALGDGSGNTINIQGTGKVGMSGWLLFQPVGDFNFVLWSKGGGTITLTESDGKKYVSKWEPVENYGYTDWWVFMKIKLAEPVSGLPMELNLELTQGARPALGSIILSTGPYTYVPTSGPIPESTGPYNTYVNLELTHTGTVYRGTGLVVIN